MLCFPAPLFVSLQYPMPKTRLTDNPLGNPTTPIHALAAEFGEYLHFPDPAPLYALMGSVAANLIPGNPVWLMLVGPPACGKTELLNSLMGIEWVRAIGSIKSPGALLSATGKKDRNKDSTGGLLRELGSHGALVMKDFTSILSLSPNELKELLGAFREIYDGYWPRNVGTDGGATLEWRGKVAVLAGCTPAIDQFSQLAAEMGERWVFFRYPHSDGFGESNQALDNNDPQEWQERLREVVASFFELLDAGWDNPIRKRDLTQEEKLRIIAMSQLSARCRSAVPRHYYTREVENISQPESPTRLATVLGQIYRGLLEIGLPDKETWRIVGKIALDSMPLTRQRAMGIIRERGLDGVEATLEEIQIRLGVSKSAVRRVVEDLASCQVVRIIGTGTKTYRLADRAVRELDSGWGKRFGKDGKGFA